jgi:YD repeat-containing protein
MKTPTYILILTIILISCKTTHREHYANFNYDYEIRSYYSNPDNPKNFRYSEFYLNGRLLRKIGRDGDCTRYFYDSTGQLIETRWGRNCNYGRRNILIYDSLKNHIGDYSTMDSIVNLDTVQFEQTFFYDSQYRLIKELTDKRRNLDGEEIETWKHYEYLGNKINREITLTNFDTIWDSKYIYDSIGNLIQIYRVRKKVYEIEVFRYNAEGLLIEKEIKSTANPITPVVTFSAGNNMRTYQYDSTGFLTTELLYNHKGKVEIKTIYLKIENNN